MDNLRLTHETYSSSETQLHSIAAVKSEIQHSNGGDPLCFTDIHILNKKRNRAA